MLDVIEANARAEAFRVQSVEVEREWYVSPLVRMECRVRALAETKTEVLHRIDEILRSVRLLSLTDEVFERAASIRAQTGLKTPDALHIATAMEHGCVELWTADERMTRASSAGLAIRLVA